ncbi:MAG: hypothetical protein PHH07_08440 [Candidatus Cloacimonetes bacterium]|nr:hypothetical protein [Candidatus Cloacimonadota bacterium]
MLYKIEWTLQSPIETQLQSDTIFGHLCWALAMELGEAALTEFLEAMQKPVLSLSSAFPQGTLPVPRLNARYGELPADLQGALVKRRTAKAAKGLSYLPLEIWLQHHHDYDHSEVIERNEAIQALVEKSFKLEQDVVVHNSINRVTGTTTKGGASLYTETVTFAREGTVFESYLDTDYFSAEQLRALFAFVENSGFGRNKHTGRGRFRIELGEHEFSRVGDPNAWLLLSNAVPAPDDPASACYDGFVKYGRLGGSYASGGRNPFKKPLFMLTPGTVFLGDRPPTGTLVRNIHPDDPAICQLGYAMCVGFHLRGGENA